MAGAAGSEREGAAEPASKRRGAGGGDRQRGRGRGRRRGPPRTAPQPPPAAPGLAWAECGRPQAAWWPPVSRVAPLVVSPDSRVPLS